MVKRLVFMGTTTFAAAVLTTLLAIKEITVVGIVCQPDRPIGRKKAIIFSPVKQIAISQNIKLFQPERIIEEINSLQSLAPDVILTCAYGQFLPSKILAIAKTETINVHASLLPVLRGGAPIQWAIIRDYQETGITLMQMSKKMDAGAIFAQTKVAIAADETYQSLQQKLIIAAQSIINAKLIPIINHQIVPTIQNENEVTFGYNIVRNDEIIDWKQTARSISCHVRGLYDKPIAYTLMNDFIFKIHQVEVTGIKSNQLPGSISEINQKGIFVATRDYQIIIKTIQPEGRKPLSATNFFGNSQQRLGVGMRFFVK